MNKIKIILPLAIATACCISCNSPSEKKEAQAKEGQGWSTYPPLSAQYASSDSGKGNRIAIDYKAEQELLEILQQLPDSAFTSWEWSPQERRQLTESVKSTGYFVDTTPRYNNLIQLSPHYLATQVVDGVWSMALYKANDGSYTIITSDAVGDGAAIRTFTYNKGILQPQPEHTLWPDLEASLFRNKEEEAVQTYLAQQDLLPAYNFDSTGFTVTVSDIQEKAAELHIKGNTLDYKFNKATKRFDLKEVRWVAE